jgi:hypothetical protein
MVTGTFERELTADGYSPWMNCSHRLRMLWNRRDILTRGWSHDISRCRVELREDQDPELVHSMLASAEQELRWRGIVWTCCLEGQSLAVVR